MNNKLILATNNRHKIFEISNILADLEIEILTASDFNNFPEVQETGKTLMENAVLKANAIFEQYSLPCIADDTGLEVDFLNGAPGVMSARFAGEECSYEDNNKKLLNLLKDTPENQRLARFKTVIAFADNSRSIQTVEGTLEGSIAREPKGNNGFGYDPIFRVTEKGVCLAELPPNEKNKISHRAGALQKIRPIIIKAFRNYD